MVTRNVGTLYVELIDASTADEFGDDPHFIAELAEESYGPCGLRPFAGAGHVGGYDHIYGEGFTREESLAELVKVLQGLNLTGTLRVRK